MLGHRVYGGFAEGEPELVVQVNEAAMTTAGNLLNQETHLEDVFGFGNPSMKIV